MASAAHAVFLSMWQEVHGFGILYLSVMAGAMKSERMSAHENAGNLRLDLWHMAGHACAARRAVLVMRVLRERCLARPVPGAGSVAIEANFVDGLTELRVILRAVHIVAIEAGHPATVHHALHEVVPLHPVFVRGARRGNA